MLAGGIAHDFNNLLTTILGHASLTQMDLPAASPVRNYIEQIVTASRRAANLCKQMLAYTGKGQVAMERVDLSQVVQETIHLLQVSISKTAAIEFHLLPNLPEIQADVSQLCQIIMNLVLNASEAIGSKEGRISVATGTTRVDRAELDELVRAAEVPDGDYVFLDVCDTGCGMAAETRQRIFDPFFTTKFTGRGLGLAAVLGIVRGHRGAIRVQSEPGQGTAFRIFFPIASAPSAGNRAKAPAEAAALTWRGEGTVLVVDDEETIRTLAACMLERLGFQALVAEDGQAALERIRAGDEQIRFLLLDLTMPHMSGDETFRAVRLLRPELPVILMSGYSEQEATARFAGQNLAGFLSKPFTCAQLTDIVRQVLGQEDSPNP